MMTADRTHLKSVLAGAACLAIVCGAVGCRNGSQLPTDLPHELARQADLGMLLQGIRADFGTIATLTADCKVAIRTPVIRDQRQVQLSGKLYLKKVYRESGDDQVKILLNLTFPGGVTGVKLVGDGTNYKVRMPGLQPPLSGVDYDGRYGDDIVPVPGRLHFMPDDLIDALCPDQLLLGKAQVLRAYPYGWDWFAGTTRAPNFSPASWHIDSVGMVDRPEYPFKILNSLMIDPNNERITRVEKFRLDGSLRVRMWLFEYRLVKAAGRDIMVPGQILIWYPPPLEKSAILLEFDRMKTNVPIEDDKFTVAM